MVEAYDAAIRRRLDVVNDWGSASTRMAGQAAKQRQAPEWATNMLPGGQIRRPNMGSGYGQIRNGIYNGPRGNEAALIAFGKMLQSRGFRISEHPAFNGGRRVTGGHSRNSRHYSNRAIDVNFAPGTSRREQQAIDRIVHLAKQYGLRSIWRKPDHFNHAHFDF